jgi:hypothetical protein
VTDLGIIGAVGGGIGVTSAVVIVIWTVCSGPVTHLVRGRAAVRLTRERAAGTLAVLKSLPGGSEIREQYADGGELQVKVADFPALAGLRDNLRPEHPRSEGR